MERRTFFKGLVAALAAAPSLAAVQRVLQEYLAGLQTDLLAAPNEVAYWQRLHQEFSLKEGLIHLNNGSIGATPVAVQEAHKAYLDRMETNPYDHAWSGFEDYALGDLQADAAEFLGASSDEVFLTRNTTEAMNLVATGMHLEPGDEVLTTDHEHPGGVWCWLHMAEIHGIRVRQVHLTTPATSKEEILEQVASGITSRTRVVSISHINTTTGLLMPVAEIAALTRPRDILLVCDGAQAPGMLDVNVQELQVDAYASSSHKWMLAPKGTGLLYVRRDVQDRIKPVSVYSGSGSGSYYAPYTAGGGTRNTPQLLAHGVAMRLHTFVGRQRIQERVLQLNRYLRDKLASHTMLELVSPEAEELSSAMASYRVHGMSVEALYQALHERDIIIKRTAYNMVVAGNDIPGENTRIIRLSTHIHNNEEQIDRFVDELFDTLQVVTPVLDVDAGTPKRFALDPNYPNPFNGSTAIRYQLPADDHVEVAVYNAQGQLVDLLADAWQHAGIHELRWNAPGKATGQYFCRITTSSDQDVQKMLLLR
jgi:isopenicillin-N epimerase